MHRRTFLGGGAALTVTGLVGPALAQTLPAAAIAAMQGAWVDQHGSGEELTVSGTSVTLRKLRNNGTTRYPFATVGTVVATFDRLVSALPSPYVQGATDYRFAGQIWTTSNNREAHLFPMDPVGGLRNFQGDRPYLVLNVLHGGYIRSSS